MRLQERHAYRLVQILAVAWTLYNEKADDFFFFQGNAQNNLTIKIHHKQYYSLKKGL